MKDVIRKLNIDGTLLTMTKEVDSSNGYTRYNFEIVKKLGKTESLECQTDNQRHAEQVYRELMAMADARTLKQLEEEYEKQSAESSKLYAAFQKKANEVSDLAGMIEKRNKIAEAKKYKAKFKKGDILMREMGEPNDCNGRVRLTGDAEYSLGGEFTYNCEYIKKDGSLAKKQPSGCAWERQLKKIKE